MTLNRLYKNLIIYLIGPMEDDSMAERVFGNLAKSFRESGVAEVLNPCEQEKEKVQEKDPEIYSILTNPEYKFATILPIGDY